MVGVKHTHNFTHKLFPFYKKHLTGNQIPLVGKSPSLYLNDIKPLRYWKLFAATDSQVNDSVKTLFLKQLKIKAPRRVLKQLVRKRLRLLTIKTTTRPLIPRTAQNGSKGDLYNSKIKHLRRKTTQRVYIKRVAMPNYILKWKTSYPLMFTNNAFDNKTKKPQIDLTISTFLRPRLNRRSRKYTKVLFKRLKRRKLQRTRKKLPVSYTNKPVADHTKWILTRTQSRRAYLTFRRRNTHPILKKPSVRRIRCKRTYSRMPKKWLSYCFSASPQNKQLAGVSHPNTSSSIQKFSQFTSKKLKLLRYQSPSVCYLFQLATLVFAKSPKTHGAIRGTPTYPHLVTRTGKSFTFKNTGMFMNALTFFNQKNPFTFKFLFKKKIYSFLYPNEVRNALMNRKKRITFYKLVYKIKHKAKQRPRYTLSSFNKFFLNHYKSSLYNTANNLMTHDLFSTKQSGLGDLDQQHLDLKGYNVPKEEILYTENFKHRGQDLSFRWSEVKIPRVRFRPGYQRMWRRARTALRESLNLRFIYQQQLTRYLVRFYKGSNQYNFSQAEMSLNRVIMYSRLLPDNPTVNAFMSQKLVYLNGRSTYDPNAILVPNDIIQLIVSMWYYITYRWISNWTLKRHKKFKKLVYRKGLAGKQKVMKLKKQRSYYTPNWIYLARYDISDIKPYLEVDYFTLSAIILYEPFQTYYFSPDEAPDFRPTIYRMYNWKYIT